MDISQEGSTSNYTSECKANALEFSKKNSEKLIKAREFYKISLRESEIYEQKAPSILDDYKGKSIFLIITANRIETGVLHAFLFEQTNQKLVKIRKRNRTYYICEINDKIIVNTWQDDLGSSTPEGSEETVRVAIKDLEPFVVLSSGVCYGINCKHNSLTDVLILSDMYSFDGNFKVNEDNSVKSKSHIYYSTEQEILHSKIQLQKY